MFARIMVVVLAAILLTNVCLSGVWWLTLRNRQIDARLDYLISEAEDIAYLAGNLSGNSLMETIQDRDSVTRTYLNRMAEKVNREFGAYIAVMDRGGNVMTNSQTAYDEDPEFMESLNGEEITQAFQRILAGETIRLRSESGEASPAPRSAQRATEATGPSAVSACSCCQPESTRVRVRKAIKSARPAMTSAAARVITRGLLPILNTLVPSHHMKMMTIGVTIQAMPRP